MKRGTRKKGERKEEQEGEEEAGRTTKVVLSLVTTDRWLIEITGRRGRYKGFAKFRMPV